MEFAPVLGELHRVPVAPADTMRPPDNGGSDVDFGRSMSLDDWLAALRDPKRRSKLITYQFPTDSHSKEYLRNIGERKDDDVRFLLRSLLMSSGTLGQDPVTAQFLVQRMKSGARYPKTEFTRRLIRAVATRGRVQAWEGVTWILDLLPASPRQALDVLDAYFDVHAAFMPDGRLMGMSDARRVIKSKYILVGDIEGSERALDKVTSREFEVLVSALFRARGYRTKLTPAVRDGGRDVIARRKEPGQREHCLIECKHHRKSIGVKDVRALLGVVSHEKATRGVLVASCNFTSGSLKLEKRNRRIELIGRLAFVRMLNEHLGTDWPIKVDELVAQEAKQHVPAAAEQA